jgi:hypothetical protein
MSGLEPLTCSLRVITQALQGVHGIANAAYLEGFPFSGLLRVAPYCVPGGIRMVSKGIDSLGLELGPVALQGDPAPALAVLLAL